MVYYVDKEKNDFKSSNFLGEVHYNSSFVRLHLFIYHINLKSVVILAFLWQSTSVWLIAVQFCTRIALFCVLIVCLFQPLKMEH